MDSSIIAKTTIKSAGMATTKVKAALVSTVNAIIMAPNTIKGERSNRRNVRFIPVCTWFISLVIRVIILDVPRVSISV